MTINDHDPGRMVYATNVRHYEHVVKAMSLIDRSPLLFRQFELARLPQVSLPRAIETPLARRVRNSDLGSAQIAGLGAAQFLNPLMARFGARLSPSLIRQVQRSEARRVSAGFESAEVFQFVEGLGHKALSKRGSIRTAIMERRNLHHSAFEGDVDVYLDFPFRARLDPIRDILDAEYEQADRIIVYSDVVRNSFLGTPHFEKCLVVPLPVVTAQHSRLRSQSRVQHRLLYVGRSDAFKGIDLAAAVVGKLGNPWVLDVAGPAHKADIAWMTRLPFVEYHGILSRHQLNALYSSRRVLLAPSVESFGLAAAEATSFGCHVICRETTGIGEFLPAQMSTQLGGRDLDTWAETAQACHDEFQEPEPQQKLNESGLGRLTDEAVVSQYLALYRSLRDRPNHA